MNGWDPPSCTSCKGTSIGERKHQISHNLLLLPLLSVNWISESPRLISPVNHSTFNLGCAKSLVLGLSHTYTIYPVSRQKQKAITVSPMIQEMKDLCGLRFQAAPSSRALQANAISSPDVLSYSPATPMLVVYSVPRMTSATTRTTVSFARQVIKATWHLRCCQFFGVVSHGCSPRLMSPRKSMTSSWLKSLWLTAGEGLNLNAGNHDILSFLPPWSSAQETCSHCLLNKMWLTTLADISPLAPFDKKQILQSWCHKCFLCFLLCYSRGPHYDFWCDHGQTNNCVAEQLPTWDWTIVARVVYWNLSLGMKIGSSWSVLMARARSLLCWRRMGCELTWSAKRLCHIFVTFELWAQEDTQIKQIIQWKIVKFLVTGGPRQGTVDNVATSKCLCCDDVVWVIWTMHLLSIFYGYYTLTAALQGSSSQVFRSCLKYSGSSDR